MRVPTDPVNLVAIAVLWMAFAYKAPALRRNPRDGSLIAFCATLLLVALSLTSLYAPIYVWIGMTSGTSNLAELLANSLAVASGCAALVFLSYLNYPPRQARRWTVAFVAIGAATLVAMAVFFVRIRAPVAQPDFWNHYVQVPFAIEYRLVYLAFLAFALANVIRLSWRFANIPNRASMTVGLRLVAIGGAIGEVYVASEAFRVIAPTIGGPSLASEPAMTIKVLTAVAVVFLVLGSTIPSWGPRLGVDTLAGWIAEYRSLRRLYPLWAALMAVTPSVSIGPAASPLTDALDLRDVRFRLYRRVVEMRDATVLLRSEPWDQDLVGDASAGSDTTRGRMAVLHSIVANRDPSEGAGVPDGSGLDLSSEVQALELLSKRYRRFIRKPAVAVTGISGWDGRVREPNG